MTATTLDTQDIRVVPIGDGPGARVDGCDRAAAWDDKTAAAIRQAWLDYEVLVFPGAPMGPEDTLAFARRFGEPFAEVNRDKRHGGLPEVSVLNSTITAREGAGDLKFDLQSVIRAEGWHTDQSFVERPALATVLHAHEVPSRGGATWFCDTRGAYDALDDAFKARLEGLRVVHGYDTTRSKHRPSERTQDEIAESPDVVHPLIRTHPETGRKGLYLNFNRMKCIDGMDPAESDALLDELAEWIAQDRFVYKHNWSVGDAVVWDNRCTMHRVQYDSPPGERRVMLRVCTQGDRPY